MQVTSSTRSVVLAAVAALALGACGGGSAQEGQATASADACVTKAVKLTVTPAASTVAQDISFKASGLGPGCGVTLRLTGKDGFGTEYASETTFSTAKDGTFDSARDVPTSGRYKAADASGPLTAMEGGGYGFFRNDLEVPDTITATLTRNGKDLATTTFTRGGTKGLAFESGKPSSPDFRAVMLHRADQKGRRPAVLLIGGSDPGLTGTFRQAVALADAGYPAMATCYFGCPKSERTALKEVPIESFAKALDDLRAMPGVDPERITVVGISRGVEAATLLAAMRPEQVHQLVLVSGNSVVWPSFNPGGEQTETSGWTVGGKPVPWDKRANLDAEQQVNDTHALPSAAFTGPVTVLCGGQDALVKACHNADVIKSRRDAKKLPTQVLRYADAGHGIVLLAPNLAAARAYEVNGGPMQGAADDSNQVALHRLWKDLLGLLEK